MTGIARDAARAARDDAGQTHAAGSRDGGVIAMKHGFGGRAMRRLIGETLAAGFVDIPVDGYGLAAMDDGAALRGRGGGEGRGGDGRRWRRDFDHHGRIAVFREQHFLRDIAVRGGCHWLRRF